MDCLYVTFNFFLNICYLLCNDFGIAIILFAAISKMVLFPISLWVQRNSIKMVSLQSCVNSALIANYGDKDTALEQQNKIYKENGYNPFSSIIPVVLQMIMLVGIIGAVRLSIKLGNVNIAFLGLNIYVIPYEIKGYTSFYPLLAGISALSLCIIQDRHNVLQKYSSRHMKMLTMSSSVGIAVVLGWFVPIAVALYWIASNLFSIVQVFILNIMIPPEKYIDFDTLEKSQNELEELKNNNRKKRTPEERKKEKRDYKQFFKIENKHLVFYSESNGYYKYFRGIIEWLIDNTNITIHYVTSDINDGIFDLSKKIEQIKSYYIGEYKLITFMMKMDADIVVMTMPDLDNYHIKRSIVKKDIEYIFVPHSMCSLNLTMRTASIDHFDTVFLTGKHQREETRKTEAAYHLPEKKLIDWGYCLLDQMRSDYKQFVYQRMKRGKQEGGLILIAPSWQKDNILDTCLNELLESLCGKGYKIVVRPHPQHVRLEPEKMERLMKHFSDNNDIEFQVDFSGEDVVFSADIMITDWSGIAFEYAFTTYKPVLFIDTPIKIMNPEYKKIDTEPFNLWIREIIGKVILPDEAGNVFEVISNMIKNSEVYRENIKKYAYEYVYNLDESGKIGGRYIANEIKCIIEKKKAEEEK